MGRRFCDGPEGSVQADKPPRDEKHAHLTHSLASTVICLGRVAAGKQVGVCL